MKVSPAGFVLAGCGVVFLVLLGCATSREARMNRAVSIESGRIVFFGAKVSADDQMAMNAILKKYNKSLFQIRNYEAGELQKRFGRLSDEVIGRAEVTKIANDAQTLSLTGITLQAGLGDMSTAGPGGVSDHPHVPPHVLIRPGPQDMANSQELVNALRPIVEKYSNETLGH